MNIKTKQVQGRRKVRYESLGDFLSDAERLSRINVRTVGNWSFGQILRHMAVALNSSIDGSGFKLPAPVRLLMRTVMKRRILTKSIPAGFRTAPSFLPEQTAVEAGLAALRAAIERQGRESKRAPHPAFGRISNEEWRLFHLRHAEMHMSFVVPVTEAL